MGMFTGGGKKYFAEAHRLISLVKDVP